MESPRATGSARRSPPRRQLTQHAANGQARRQLLPRRVSDAALAAAGVLTITGRGDVWTVALAAGVADTSAVTALVVAAAAVAALARTGSAYLGDIAGAQAVLGAAGFTGSAVAIVAAWASAASLLVVARRRAVGAVLGLLAGALVAGPSFNGGIRSIAVAVAGLAGGAAAGWFLTPADGRRRWQRFIALAAAAAGVALGVVAGYH